MIIEPFGFEKTVTEYITEKYKLTDEFYLEVKYIDGRITQQNIFSFKKIPNSNFRYIIDLKNFEDQCKKNYFYSEVEGRGYWWVQYICDDPLKELKDGKFDENKIINIRTWDHSFLDRTGKHLDSLIHIDYIRGRIKQRPHDIAYDYMPNYSWKELKQHLSKHPNVINLSENNIPYYNAIFSGQKALEMDVIFLSEWWPKLNKTGAYISWDHIIHGDSDPLQIKQFIIK